MYYVYMLRCEDSSIYTGITNDLQRRMDEHFNKTKKCAKYTMQHKANKLECVFETLDRVNASKLEYHIKKNLTKAQKEQLIQQEIGLDILGDKIDKDNYKRLEQKMNNKVKVITICGSLKFKDEMIESALKLELEGNVVLMPIFPIDGNKDSFSEEQFNMLGKMHKEKINLSDAIFVVNVGGYIGNSTKSEIEYAKEHNKKIIYLENNNM